MGIENLMMKVKTVDIDINTYQGVIQGDLIVYEKGGDPWDGLVLYGFDEVGMFDNEFKTPQYAFSTDDLNYEWVGV
tara:strand:- start:170 stop:397 length:228 start_codon:yes stop_codon:yes gene_type:complete